MRHDHRNAGLAVPPLPTTAPRLLFRFFEAPIPLRRPAQVARTARLQAA